MIYTPKTQVNNANVKLFLKTIEDPQKQKQAFILLELFNKITWEKEKMWWSSIIGFGNYNYEWKSCKWEWMRTGFAPRKAGFSIYIMPWYNMGMQDLLNKLWKYKLGKSCINIKKLDDIDLEILGKIIKKWLIIMEKEYPLNKTN